MSLFICDECGNVDNTAGSSFWITKRQTGKHLCCECTPNLELVHSVHRDLHLTWPLAPWKGQVVLNPPHPSTGIPFDTQSDGTKTHPPTIEQLHLPGMQSED